MSKREDIIKGTIEVVAKAGISNAPTLKIAKQSGAAEYTLFRLFENKEALLLETYNEIISQFHQAYAKETFVTGSFEAKFKTFLSFTVDYFKVRPDELSYLQQYINSPAVISERPDIRYENGEDVSNYPIINILGQGRTDGVLKKMSMTALVSISIMTIIMFLREEEIRNIKHDQQEIDLLIEACWQGIKA